MNRLFSLLIPFLIFGFTANASIGTKIQTDKKIPVVVELFTAEGCSSCPAADKYFQMLLERQPVAGVEIIGLSQHVDYWNQFGWIDPFSSAQFSNRQKYYAAFFKRIDIYTPQFVVNGTEEISPKQGDKSLADYAKAPKGKINLTVQETIADTVSFNILVSDLPKISDGDKAVAVLALTENNLSTEVSGGENSGRKLKHAAVVRYLKTIEEIDGTSSGESKFSARAIIAKNWKSRDLSAVVFVQEAAHRRILAAAKINLN